MVVPLVVVGNGAAAAALKRQPRLGAVQPQESGSFRLPKHDGMSMRIKVEADDVAQLCGARQIRCTQLTLMPICAAIAGGAADLREVGWGRAGLRPAFVFPVIQIIPPDRPP